MQLQLLLMISKQKLFELPLLLLPFKTELQRYFLTQLNSGNTAIVDLDLIPSLTNYRVTWKDTYESWKWTKWWMILRWFWANSNNPWANQWYLFQTSYIWILRWWYELYRDRYSHRHYLCKCLSDSVW